MISILWVSLYQTPRTAAIEELHQETIQMYTKETPTSSAMTWQQHEETRLDSGLLRHLAQSGQLR